VIVTEERPAVAPDDTFDIIYAGGGLNVLNAAVMTCCYHLRILIFDRFTVGAVHREWNISREELQELLDIGLFTISELESVIQREYRDGLVRFHGQNIKTPPIELHLQNVLNIAIDAEALTALCVKKIREQQPAGSYPNVVLSNTSFQRGAVQPGHGVTVDITTQDGMAKSYQARLLIDGMGSTSPIACQLNHGYPFSLVCPTVGTVARGYKKGKQAGAVDANLGEILVTTEDARNGRQLIWETFPGKDDQVAIYLFYYTEIGQPVNLLDLFNEFFALLPGYKDTSEVEIIKPVYGFIPAGYNVRQGQHRQQKILAYHHVLSLGDAAALHSPLTFCGFGSSVRNLRRITTLLAQALACNSLSAQDLNRIHAFEAVPAVSRAFSKFMIAKPEGQEPAWQVNETLNIFCHVLGTLGPQVTNDFFKDRISWLDYTRIVLQTPRYYPRIYALALKTLNGGEILNWITAWLQLGEQELSYRIYRSLASTLQPHRGSHTIQNYVRQRSPQVAFRLTHWLENMEQITRGRSRTQKPKPPLSKQRGFGFWLGSKWPAGS